MGVAENFARVVQYDSDTGEKLDECTLIGQLIGYEHYDAEGLGYGYGIYKTAVISHVGNADPLRVNGPPTLTASLSARTVGDLAWAAYDDPDTTPPTLSWEVQRRESTDNGDTFSTFAEISASPFAASTINYHMTGLPFSSPEIIFEWRVRSINSVGEGVWSSPIQRQWNGNPLNPPTAPTNLSKGLTGADYQDLLWAESVDNNATKHGLFSGITPGVLVADNIGATVLNYRWSGLTPGATYDKINVRRFGNGQWSGPSPVVSFTIPGVEAPDFVLKAGTSDGEAVNNWPGATSSSGLSGGIGGWACWRTYNKSNMYIKANLAGANRPEALLYSEDPATLGGANPNYNTIYNHCLDELDEFYYTGVSGRATGGSHSSRWGIKLYWSNGNENFEAGKGAAPGSTTWTSQQISNITISQKALYDACHYESSPGVRRYPDAKAGTDPTQEQDRKGWVAPGLHSMAKYCDFIAWSVYMPGRGVNDTTLSRYARLDWPSFAVLDAPKLQPGYLIRTFERNRLARRQARIDLGQDPDTGAFDIEWIGGEFGMPSNPDDRTCRPYFAVHGMMGAMYILAKQYGMIAPYACYWSSSTGGTDPHNFLSDEPPNSDHISQGTGDSRGAQSTPANPSTAYALQHWYELDKRIPGSVQPLAWAGNPQTKVTVQSQRDGTHWYSTGTPV